MADSEERVDKELEEFRSLMEVPDTFEEGFRWSSFLGALFIALLMVPGALYMGLLAGPQAMGAAAQWVTVILFIEVAKRTHQSLKKSEIFVLYWMAAAAMGMPFAGLLWNQFYARSDAAVASGVAQGIPDWFAPALDSTSYAARSFFHADWLPVIGLIIFGSFFGEIKSMVLGYGLFRIASDIEKLPFPMAPIGVQGILAVAEDADIKRRDVKEQSWRWRTFAVGGALGLAWGLVYLALPTISGVLTGKPLQIFPIPFADFTPVTGKYLSAVATGICWDMNNVVVGMVLPFWAMVGSFIGLVVTMVFNPILYSVGILNSWREGDSTVPTMFHNHMDFYFSFQIGIALAICVAGLYQVYRSVKNSRKKARQSIEGPSRQATVPKGRGDIPTWVIVGCYVGITLTYILVCGWLIGWHKGVMIVLFLLGFVYTPLISYVTARLEGIAGQVVEIPFIKEISLIASGYGGVAVWFLPIPIANYGMMTVFYRQCELIGAKFTSIWKAKIFLYPIILVSSIVFANFIWNLAEVPSAIYPFAQKIWPLQAEQASIMFSSTLGEYSRFEEALDERFIGWGAGFGLLLFGILGKLGAPIFFTYGVVRGLGQSMPHGIIPQFVGALLGRFYFRRRFGKMWRKYIPVIAAGFACGMGLITAFGIGLVFLKKAVVQLPF